MSDEKRDGAGPREAGSGDGDQVSRIAQLARESLAVRPIDGNPHLFAVAKDVRVVSEAAIRFPGAKAEEFIERFETFTDPRSYATYISVYGGEDTCVLIDADAGRSRSILNYVPKPSRRRSLAKTGVNYFPCTWQADLSLRSSDVWRRLIEFSSGEALTQGQVYLLISLLLKNGLSGNDEESVGFDARRGHREDATPESMKILEQLFDAEYIQDDLLSKLAAGAKSGRWLCDFRVSVHRGARPVPVMVLLDVRDGEVKLHVVDPSGCERQSAEGALSEVRRVLRGSFGSEFNTYEADLTDE